MTAPMIKTVAALTAAIAITIIVPAEVKILDQARNLLCKLDRMWPLAEQIETSESQKEKNQNKK